MDLEFYLNVLDFLLIAGIALATAYLSTKIGHRKLRLLTTLLAGFLILHGIYHLTAAIGGLAGLDYVGIFAETVVEPLSWAFFLAFAVYFLRNT